MCLFLFSYYYVMSGEIKAVLNILRFAESIRILQGANYAARNAA